MASSIERGSESDEGVGVLLVDGFNLLHATILKGRDRASWWNTENQTRVLKLVQGYQGPETCWLIFDAARVDSERLPFPQTESWGREVSTFYAPSADDMIVELVQKHLQRSRTVVSADRALQDRCSRYGTNRLSPWAFRDLCGVTS